MLKSVFSPSVEVADNVRTWTVNHPLVNKQDKKKSSTYLSHGSLLTACGSDLDVLY